MNTNFEEMRNGERRAERDGYHEIHEIRGRDSTGNGENGEEPLICADKR